MKNRLKALVQKLAVSLVILCGVLALTASLQPQKSFGGGPQGGFTFHYNLGSVTNYHAYGYAVNATYVATQPTNTVLLGTWYVWDLGPTVGAGSVVCPKPLSVKGVPDSAVGLLWFADAGDIGGQPFTHPVPEAQIFMPKFNNGSAEVEIIVPPQPYTGITLYYGPQFTPFGWDFSSYVY